MSEQKQHDLSTREGCFEAFLEQKAKAEQVEAQLAALQWQPITPENMPKVGDEIGWPDGMFNYFIVNTVRKGQDKWKYEDWLDSDWTHFRPITPPAKETAE